jgi:hypothetical protein
VNPSTSATSGDGRSFLIRMLVQSATYHHTIFYVISAKAARANGQDLCGRVKDGHASMNDFLRLATAPTFTPNPPRFSALPLPTHSASCAFELYSVFESVCSWMGRVSLRSLGPIKGSLPRQAAPVAWWRTTGPK